MGSQGDPVGMLGFHRQRCDKDFTDREKEIISLLMPHLSRAIHNINLIETITESQGIGMIVISKDGNPPYMNDEARRALNRKPVESIPDPGLGLASVFFKAETGVYVVRTVMADHGSRGKTILLEPLPAEYDIQPKLTEFGLSKREGEIALLVVRGCSNREIAERLFIQEQTVKDHLSNIFEKMKIRRRSELATKVLRVRFPL